MGTFTKSFGAAGGYIAADKVCIGFTLVCLLVWRTLYNLAFLIFLDFVWYYYYKKNKK